MTETKINNLIQNDKLDEAFNILNKLEKQQLATPVLYMNLFDQLKSPYACWKV